MFFSSRNPDRVRTWNIVVNAIAVMLVYSSYYGGAAVMPTAFADMAGRNGIDDHTAFTGLMINNLFVVIAAMFTPYIIQSIGLRLSLVVGSLCTIPISVALFIPYNITILIGQAINGMGNAFTRAVSLQFLAENSPKRKMAKNSGIHWMIFMSCILFGNLVLYFGIGDKTHLDDHTRMVIAGALTAMCSTGCMLYCFTSTPPPLTEEDMREEDEEEEDEEKKPILQKRNVESATDDTVKLIAGKTVNGDDSDDDEDDVLCNWEKFKQSLQPLFQKKNLYLLLPLCTTGTYSQLYTPLLPAYIGSLFPNRSFVAQFGIFVGIGEILGGRLAGKIVKSIGFKKASVFVSFLGVCAFVLIAVMFPLSYSKSMGTVLPTSHWGNNALGVAIGIIDVSNNVIITTAIGTVFKDSSAQVFTLVVIMMNSSGIVRYLMMSYVSLALIVPASIFGLIGSSISLCLIKTT